LLRTGQLKEHPSNIDEIERLLTAAARSIRDASADSISSETRFDAAYKAIIQSALAAIQMHGLRPDTKKPGHHVVIIQTLPLTIGLTRDRVNVLDTFRRQRNLSDYTGDGIDDSSVQHCIDEANQLLKRMISWRKANRPQFVPKR